MQAQQLNQLRAAIAAVEKRAQGCFSAAKAESGCAGPEREKTALGSFFGPGLHEWFAETDPWTPPLGVFLYLARTCLDADRHAIHATHQVIWVGLRCRPYLWVRDAARIVRRSIFIDPPDDARLWTIDLAARCPAVAAVVADGSGLDMAATRRIQLAAEAGSVPVLCARPPGELKSLSAASTRWRVRCVPATTDKNPRWIVKLLRCKGMQPEEWNRAQGGVVIPAALVCRPDSQVLRSA